MKPKYEGKDDYIENPVDGRPLLRPFMPISGIILFILIIFLFHNCHETKSVNKNLNNKQTFTYISKTSKDTTKFYGYNNIDSAVYYAKKEKKNILLIFSGYACMSESGKEWKTLSLFCDNDKIQHNFIITWLAVDDTKPAKDTNQIVFWYGKERKLVKSGDKNKYFEEVTFRCSTQPLFCFIDTLQVPFGKILGYTNVKKEVEDFIYSGIITH